MQQIFSGGVFMTKVSIEEAKDQLIELVNEAVKGKEVIISNNGENLVKLVPMVKINNTLHIIL